ncbi:AAA family ATPase [Sphingomonas qilianensis]|uniref:AAA family ATPase n=1 Tax=Sphingomonas qilianensis TaxID=1736690 RepID=A0ABU9XTR2_9SPHN
MSDRDLIFYDEKGARFQPVKHFNRATGRSAYRVKPRGASNRTEDFLEVDTIEEIARAMLVDGLAARVKAFSGGPVSVLRFGADTLASYELSPAIAEQLGIPARSGAPAPAAGTPQLEGLRTRFLSAYADFEDIGGFAATSGAYYAAYRSRVDALLSVAATHAADGWAVLQDILRASQTGRGALPPFFDGDVNWRTPRARDANPVAFDRALDALTQGAGDPPIAISAFNEVFWPALSAIGEPNTFRDTRVIPSTVLAALAPDRAISVRYQLYSNAERLLNDRSLFANKPMTADEYRAVLALADQIRMALVGWGWKPRDLWDVHGFILATCADRNVDPAFAEAAPMPIREPAMPSPTNLILYGPPGTGKTHATAREAVLLCGEIPPDDRDELMLAYRRLLDAGRIEFVTFHQSMAYEEFVEGLRPTTSGNSETGADIGEVSSGGFRLEPQDGIFKQISERARLSEVSDAPRHLDRRRSVFKIALGRRGEEENRIDEGLQQGLIHLGWGGTMDWSGEQFDTFEPIRREWLDKVDPAATGKDPNIEMMYTFRAAMRPGDYVILSDGRDIVRAVAEITGEYFYDPAADFHPHRRTVKWLWQKPSGVPRERFYPRQFRRHSTYQLSAKAIDWDALDDIVYPSDGVSSGVGAPHVLIIDEINRANISKVFGELITLLEPDKRLGAENALRVRLPYSRDLFGVPANLHIIGTMNTADRSIALLDTALRRRFDFREMMPDASILPAVTGINLSALLTRLNERIEYLFDREHQVGHAFFMGCKTRADVDGVMRRKVLPLLAEYFHEDWGKIAAVLGDAKGERFLKRTLLAAPDGLETEYGGERYRWSVRKPERDTDSFGIDAYAGLA